MLGVWSNSLPAPLAKLIHSGYFAVQVFFVLSGFVLARTYAHARWDRRSLGRFFTARFARIYPVYFASLIVVSPFIIEMTKDGGVAAERRFGVLTDYLLVLQGWTASLGVGWNTPAWSLSCEFFFYLCFPVLFVVLGNARWPGIAAAIVTAVLFPITLDHSGVPWTWKPVYQLGDFVAGIAAARAYTLLMEYRTWSKPGYWLYLPALVAGVWLIIHPDATSRKRRRCRHVPAGAGCAGADGIRAGRRMACKVALRAHFGFSGQGQLFHVCSARADPLVDRAVLRTRKDAPADSDRGDDLSGPGGCGVSADLSMAGSSRQRVDTPLSCSGVSAALTRKPPRSERQVPSARFDKNRWHRMPCP